MTALATVFALTPMALGLTGGGGFISQPLAIVVIGGLVSSTALTLILVPVLYKLVEGRREKKQLLKELQHRPEVTPGMGNGGNSRDDFADWTTGMVPRITGRRAANNPAE
jgi:HAE1 family hydrophobic/amphiphilic exporter-1